MKYSACAECKMKFARYAAAYFMLCSKISHRAAVFHLPEGQISLKKGAVAKRPEKEVGASHPKGVGCSGFLL
jgi:hypothetical protein